MSEVEVDEGSAISASFLYDGYTYWCFNNDLEPLSRLAFGSDFSELKVHSAPGPRDERLYIGISGSMHLT
jgi:hypothetical protein